MFDEGPPAEARDSARTGLYVRLLDGRPVVHQDDIDRIIRIVLSLGVAEEVRPTP